MMIPLMIMLDFYDSIFRHQRANTYYRSHKVPASRVSNLQGGIAAAFLILIVSFLVLIPTFKAARRTLKYFVGAVSYIIIGGCILYGIYGYSWSSSQIVTRTPYKAWTQWTVVARIGFFIGLTGVNVTMVGEPKVQLVGGANTTFTYPVGSNQQLTQLTGSYANETIEYNEHFDWRWQQGRRGYGRFSGRINREFRAAQFRGSPLPILWIAEYFTIDGEDIRWGRQYRTSGYWVYQCLWVAFGTYIISMILLPFAPRSAGLITALTGTVMLIANSIYEQYHASTGPPLKIPFEDAVMEAALGWSFYLVLIGGLFSFCIGVFLMWNDMRKERAPPVFFWCESIRAPLRNRFGWCKRKVVHMAVTTHNIHGNANDPDYKPSSLGGGRKVNRLQTQEEYEDVELAEQKTA